MIDRLDEERIEILRSWGIGLASDDREELRAAGKAITVLIEEIERLHVDLWSARVAERGAADDNGMAEPDRPERDGAAREQLVASTQGSALRDRLARVSPNT